MPRDYRVALEDILTSIAKVRAYSGSLNFEAFSKDDKTVDAVVRNLEIIGEAVKQVPEAVRASNPKVDWRSIAGLRDVLIHSYFGINLEIVWDVVANKLPILENEVARILKEEDVQ